MSQADIGTTGLLLASALVVVAIALSAWQQLGLERTLVWAGLRAAVQLLVVGAALGLVLDPSTPLVLAGTWVVAMVFFAAWTVRRRAPEVPGAFGLALAAFSSALVVTLGLLFGLGVYDLNARTLVPLAGMVVGNSITATVLVARRLVDEARDKRDELEARLALGQTSTQAFRSILRRVVRTALTPQIETTKAVGIVFLPGAMVGLILAGVEPLDAVRVQAAVMYMVLGAVATTVTVVATGLSRRLFTSDHRPIHLPTPNP